MLIYISLTLTLSLTWSHFIPSSSYHLGVFLPFSLCFPSCLASSLVNLSPATPTLPLPLASALCTPSLLFVYFPPPTHPSLSASPLCLRSHLSLLLLKNKSTCSFKASCFLPLFFFYPPLILHSHHRNQDQHTPHAQTSHPRLLLCSQLRQNRQREGGGSWTNQRRIAPPKATSTSERDAVHISGYTLRHKDTWLRLLCILSLSFSPSCCRAAQTAAESHFEFVCLFFYCFFLFFARCHTLGLFGSRGCFCEPTPQVNSHT